MNIKKIILFILLIALTACSNTPKENVPKKDVLRQETTVALDTTLDENNIIGASKTEPSANHPLVESKQVREKK
ncbi:hypothetical protein VT98_12832, partial [Candidatus Electrothrix communis]